MCAVAEETAALLEKHGISAAVINPRWIKPLDTGTLEFFARSVELLCTFEDHVLHNGYGCAVMEHLAEECIHLPIVRIGWPDQFVEHGAVEILRKKHGLTAEAALERILAILEDVATPETKPAETA
jgi:1-deoxy-D-xylulose-5-phosphate synthase